MVLLDCLLQRVISYWFKIQIFLANERLQNEASEYSSGIGIPFTVSVRDTIMEANAVSYNPIKISVVAQ